MLLSLIKETRSVLYEKRSKKKDIHYLEHSFPDELTGIVHTFLDKDTSSQSKEELKSLIEHKVREGVPFIQEFLYVPGYQTILKVCARRLRISSTSDVYDLEQNIIDTIQKKREQNLPILIRPWFLSKLVRIDPAPSVKLLPHLHKLHDTTRKRLVIGVVGSPSSGKDTALRAIFGIDTGNIMPIAGSTKSIEIYEYQQQENILIVNTPGMGDVSQVVTQRAVDTLENIGIYLYLLNSEGGLQAREYDDLKMCIDSKKPVIVILNKIDCLREKNREEFIASVQSQLPNGIQLIPSCLDPLPGLMEPMGINESRTLLAQYSRTLLSKQTLMEEGKEIEQLFLKPAPKPVAHKMKTVSVEPNMEFAGVNIRNMFSSPSDLIKHHPIATTLASAILLFLVSLPIMVLSAPIIVLYIAFTGLIQLSDFAKETVKEKVQDVQQGLVLPSIKNATVEANVTTKQLSAIVTYEGPNIDSTSLSYSWIQTKSGTQKKIIQEGTLPLKKGSESIALFVDRKKVQKGADIHLRVFLKNLVSNGQVFNSKIITIPNQPIESLRVNISSSSKNAQMGDILFCEGIGTDLDSATNPDEITYTYKWVDDQDRTLHTEASIITCQYPKQHTFHCIVTATDGQKELKNKKTITLIPLVPSKPKRVFAAKLPTTTQRNVEELDQFCTDNSGYSYKTNSGMKSVLFQSWFSDSKSKSPYSSFERSAGLYIADTRKNRGKTIAKDWCDLTINGLRQPIPYKKVFSAQIKLVPPPKDALYRTQTDSMGQFLSNGAGVNYQRQGTASDWTNTNKSVNLQKSEYIYCFEK